MIETREVAVGTRRYKLTTLPSGVGLSIFMRLLKLGGPLIGVLQPGKSVLDIDTRDAFERVLQDMGEADVRALQDAFGPRTQIHIGGDDWAILTETKINDVFAGNLIEYFEWLLECLKYNYPDFLDAAKRAMQKAREKAQTQKQK